MCRWLEFLAAEMAANRNFELVQALLRVTMQVSLMIGNVYTAVRGQGWLLVETPLMTWMHGKTEPTALRAGAC